jgi:hypothetical protein
MNKVAQQIILQENNVDSILARLYLYVIPHIDIFMPIYTFGTFKNYTFYTHGYIDHKRCSRRCIKDCSIDY